MKREQKKTFFIVIFAISIFFLFIALGTSIINFKNTIILKNDAFVNGCEKNKYNLISYISDNSLAFSFLLFILLVGYGIQIFKQNRIIHLTIITLSIFIFVYSIFSMFYVTKFTFSSNSAVLLDYLNIASSYQASLIQICFPVLLSALANVYLLFVNEKDKE